MSGSLEMAKAIYDDKGYVRIPAVFSRHDCELIRLTAQAGAKYRPQDVQWLRADTPAILFWPQNHDTAMYSYSHDKRLARIVAHFLGDNVRQINNQVYFRQGGDGDQFAWHQDIMFRPKADFDGIEDNYLQTIIVVDAMTEESGAIEFIPGSHRRGDKHLFKDERDPALRKFVRGPWRGEKAWAKPGDVIVWHPLTIHGSEPNTTKKPRMTYMSGFAAEQAIVNKDKYPVYVTV